MFYNISVLNMEDQSIKLWSTWLELCIGLLQISFLFLFFLYFLHVFINHCFHCFYLFICVCEWLCEFLFIIVWTVLSKYIHTGYISIIHVQVVENFTFSSLYSRWRIFIPKSFNLSEKTSIDIPFESSVKGMIHMKFKDLIAGLGGSVGCAVRLETRRSRVQSPPRSATFFRGDWSWNIFYGHSLASADSRRTVVSFWRKNVHNTG